MDGILAVVRRTSMPDEIIIPVEPESELWHALDAEALLFS